MRLRSRSWWPAVVVLFVVTLVYMVAIDLTQLYSDEQLVYYQTRLGLDYTLWYQTYQDVHPPLWFSTFWAWRQLVGISEYAGRMLAVLFSMLTLAVVYRLGTEWFGGRRCGLLAMAFLGVSGYHVAHAVEIRPYALTMLLAVLSMWSFSRWVWRGERRWALVWGALAGVSLYVHYFMAFLYVIQAVYALLTVRITSRMARQVVLAAALALLIWGPWVPFMLGQVRTLQALAAEAGTAYGTGLGTNATTSSTSLPTLERYVRLVTNGQWALYGLLLALAVSQARRRSLALGLAWAFGVPALALLANTAAAVFAPRYYAYMTPGLALVAAGGLGSLRPRWSWTLGLFSLAIIGTALPATLPDRPPARDMLRAMSADWQPGDAVRIDGESEERRDPVLDLQMAQYLRPELYDHRLFTLDGALPRRIWFMTSDWFGPGVQERFSALEATHPLQQVLGDCNKEWCFLAQLMEAPPNAERVRFGPALGYRGADVRSSAQQVALRLWWQNDGPVDRDYSFSVQVFDAAGAFITNVDGPLNDYGREIVQSSQMTPGRIYVDERTVIFPDGTPAGVYSLRLVVYQPWDGARLTLVDGADSLDIGQITRP